jgi:two-component system OmpR family response regulator
VQTRVFVVEDMRRMRGLLADLFDSLGGFTIVAVASGEAEADLWVQDHPGEFDLAVIDLILEQGSGMGVIARCKAAGAKVVVLSSYATPGVGRHCMKLGADGVFEKANSAEFMAWCNEQGRVPA